MFTNGDLFDSSKIFTSFGNVKGSEFNATTDNTIASAQRYEYIWVDFLVKKILYIIYTCDLLIILTV